MAGNSLRIGASTVSAHAPRQLSVAVRAVATIRQKPYPTAMFRQGAGNKRDRSTPPAMRTPFRPKTTKQRVDSQQPPKLRLLLCTLSASVVNAQPISATWQY